MQNIKFGITEGAMNMAIQLHGMEGMSRGELSSLIQKQKKLKTYSAAVNIAAARRVRFKKRVMGWN